MIFSVDERLRAMLESRAGAKEYLQTGSAFAELPCSTDGGPHASRMDHLVAHLCDVGVRTVQSVRSRVLAARERGQFLPAPALQRGTKRKPEEAHAASQSQDQDVEEDVSAFRDAGREVFQGVIGKYVQASRDNAANHATALVLGRIYLYASVTNIPDRLLTGIMSLFHMAGVDIGQKHHHHRAISSFGGIVARMCLEAVAKAWAKAPKNLQHPSSWRLIFDGVTLRNGVTVTAVLVCYTSASGDIAVDYIGCVRCGSRSDAASTGRGVLDLLNKVLKVCEPNSACYSRRGLRLAAGGPAPREERLLPS